jgi:hypothetical protein
MEAEKKGEALGLEKLVDDLAAAKKRIITLSAQVHTSV